MVRGEPPGRPKQVRVALPVGRLCTVPWSKDPVDVGHVAVVDGEPSVQGLDPDRVVSRVVLPPADRAEEALFEVGDSLSSGRDRHVLPPVAQEDLVEFHACRIRHHGVLRVPIFRRVVRLVADSDHVIDLNTERQPLSRNATPGQARFGCRRERVPFNPFLVNGLRPIPYLQSGLAVAELVRQVGCRLWVENAKDQRGERHGGQHACRDLHFSTSTDVSD